MSRRISDGLIDPADGDARNVDKLLVIAAVLMRQSEQGQGDRNAAFEEFCRAAALEDRIRRRTHDLEAALKLLSEANNAAERAGRNLSQAIEAIKEGFALFDADEAMVLCNSRFCQDFHDIRAKLRPGILFADYIDIVSRSSALALPAGMTPAAWASERMRHHRLGQVFNAGLTQDRWLQVSEQCTTDGGTVVLQTDVTGIIRAERSERGKLLDNQARMIRATLEHLGQGVGIFDAHRRLIGWNGRLAQLLEIPAKLLEPGTGFTTILARIARDGILTEDFDLGQLLAWVRGEPLRPPLSFELRRSSGVVLDVFAQGMPGRGFVMSFTDVTRERLAIHAMLRANATLEARVVARTEELAEALTNAERANFARARFVAAASHDLLQPLSAAKLFVAAARDDAGTGTLGSTLGGTLEKAHNALLSVEGILSALLDISRLEAGAEVEISAVPLPLLLAQLTDEFAPAAAKKGLRLTILPCRLTVRSDPTYLRRILQNLISNAIRYTARGRVLVGARRSGGAVRIEVHDTGPGIAPEHREEIFREFHRIEGAASDGIGLGLAIVERACALLDHRLTLRSQPGQGACFAVEMPRVQHHSRASLGDTPADVPDEPDQTGERIVLLVENDDAVRRAVSLLLERRGVSVLEAVDGEAALSLLEEIGIVPDVYLVDQQLGAGMTGLETARILHARYGIRPTRVITANRDPRISAAARAAGLEIMFKPIDPDALETFVLQSG